MVTASSVRRVRPAGAFQAAVHVLCWPRIRERALPSVDAAREQIDRAALRAQRWQPDEQVMLDAAWLLERGEEGPAMGELAALGRDALAWVLSGLALVDHRFAGLVVVPPDGFGPEVADERAQAAARALGPSGRLLAGSEISYRHELPDHVPVFGCSVCVADGRSGTATST